MLRTFYLLLLMLFTFDFPRGRTVDAETGVRASTGIVNRDDDQSNRVRKFIRHPIRANSLINREIIREEILVY